MYQAEISRTSPSAFLFLIDQSGSMDDKTAYGKTLAEMVSDSINKILNELVLKCSKSKGVTNNTIKRIHSDLPILDMQLSDYGADSIIQLIRLTY